MKIILVSLLFVSPLAVTGCESRDALELHKQEMAESLITFCAQGVGWASLDTGRALARFPEKDKDCR